MDNYNIGRQELLIKEIIENNKDFSEYKIKKLRELQDNINKHKEEINYNNSIMKKYLNWINNNKKVITNNLKQMYTFYNFKYYNLELMEDYYDVPNTDKLFSFSLFITNYENLSYFIGIAYNFAIIKKHFKDYKMRIYVDFNSVFGSPETFEVFNMFIDIIKEIQPNYHETIQIIVFYLNPFYQINNLETIYDNIVNDLNDVKTYYTNVFYNTSNKYIKSPLLNFTSTGSNTNPNSNTYSTVNNLSNTFNLKDVDIHLSSDIDIKYIENRNNIEKSKFGLLSCHISVNLRFLPINENCEYHIRDLDSRLSLTDKNIIKKFYDKKYTYVPYYTFQFYKHYFSKLKWRIDSNPYLGGCWGGDNRKNVMISQDLMKNENFKILTKKYLFKYILFLSLNSTNLQIGFLNDEFILATIFERIKGTYSENILYFNLGSYSNKHVNEYYYGVDENTAYPCILKLGVPVDILKYPLRNNYITIDPIVDFKISNINRKYNDLIKILLKEQLNIYLNLKSNKEPSLLSLKIRDNFNTRKNQNITKELENALFFSMINTDNVINKDLKQFDNNYTNSSIGMSYTQQVKNENLKQINFMLAGYLLADILEDIIFPKNPQYVNSNSYVNDENYDRLFNCLYFDETKKTFVQKKINKTDLSKRYFDKTVVDKIPTEYLDIKSKDDIKQIETGFNKYITESIYFPTMIDYLNSIPYTEYVNVNGKKIKTGVLIFIKDYTEPIYDINNKQINKINELGVHNILYNINEDINNVEGIEISKKKLRFNILFFDDKFINQFVYHDTNNKSKINIKMIQDTYLNSLITENNILYVNKL
jgi:hypothetical protein